MIKKTIIEFLNLTNAEQNHYIKIAYQKYKKELSQWFLEVNMIYFDRNCKGIHLTYRQLPNFKYENLIEGDLSFYIKLTKNFEISNISMSTYSSKSDSDFENNIDVFTIDKFISQIKQANAQSIQLFLKRNNKNNRFNEAMDNLKNITKYLINVISNLSESDLTILRFNLNCLGELYVTEFAIYYMSILLLRFKKYKLTTTPNVITNMLIIGVLVKNKLFESQINNEDSDMAKLFSYVFNQEYNQMTWTFSMVNKSQSQLIYANEIVNNYFCRNEN